MIIPLEWLKEYVNVRKPNNDIADSLTALGLMQEKPIEKGVLEVEHRMDRSDWLSVLGCARDLAALEGLKLKKPEGLAPPSKGNGLVEIKVKAPDLVKRFNTRVFRNLEVKDSPKWLKERLEAYGLPSKNNIVDITNYVMVELGQPMHAQDLSKFSKQEIVLRKAKNGEKITTLLGEEVELDKTMLVLAEGNNLLAIGAIVGGATTGVDETTTDIILDAGNYNQSNIRKTSRKLGIRNETVLRTEKFLHPDSTQAAIERAAKLILDLAGGDYYENEDYYKNEIPYTEMGLRYSRVERIGGIEMHSDNIKEILLALEYEIIEENTAGLKLRVPYFRTDVLVEDDIVSDVLRINNYKNIPVEQIEEAPPKEITPEIYKYEEKIRDVLVGLGLHEHITNPLIKENGESTKVTLVNALNAEQSALREEIYETLKPVLEVYKKHKLKRAKIFEVGLTYHKTGNKYENLKEVRTLEVILDTERGVEESNTELKQILSAFLTNLGIANVRYEKSGSRAVIYKERLELGELRLDSFSLYTESLLKADKKQLRVRDRLLHKTSEDITIEVASDKQLGPVISKIKESSDKISEVYVVDSLTKDNKLAITIRIIFEDENEISREEIAKIKDSIRI